ncbi:MAG: hypothetical protein FJ404_12945 [Verrucomicrobia bacterium]|nr:hypothetical protein [Verrucomicrobiota bacterium]
MNAFIGATETSWVLNHRTYYSTMSKLGSIGAPGPSVTGPWPGHAPSMRLAPGQNPGAGELEFMVARFPTAAES